MPSSTKIDLLDVAIIFAKNKKTLFTVVIVTTVLGLITSLIWPKTFKSELSFIVSENSTINFSGGGLISGLANLSSSGGYVTADQVLVIVRSNEILNKVIERFDLDEVFGNNVPEVLRKKLDGQITVDEKREGGLGFNSIISVTLSYSDKEPERAYELLTYYFETIQEKAKDLNKENIEGAYFLLKNRLEKNENELKIAEDSLVKFQEEHGILEVEEQAKIQIQSMGLLKTEIVKLEIQINYLKNLMDTESSALKELILQKREYEKKYDEMIEGVSKIDSKIDPFYSVTEMPELFIEYLRLYRDVVVQEEIYKVLFPQFEQQKLRYEEVNSGLKIIDPALLPTYKDSPKRAYIVIASFLFGCFLSVLIIMINQYKRRVKEQKDNDYLRFKELGQSLKSWK